MLKKIILIPFFAASVLTSISAADITGEWEQDVIISPFYYTVVFSFDDSRHYSFLLYIRKSSEDWNILCVGQKGEYKITGKIITMSRTEEYFDIFTNGRGRWRKLPRMIVQRGICETKGDKMFLHIDANNDGQFNNEVLFQDVGIAHNNFDLLFHLERLNPH